MFGYYLKITIRNLRRNPYFSLINISGLTIGITVCVCIYIFVSYEKSYDSFYPDNQRIYRVSYTKYLNGDVSERLAKSPDALAEAIRNEMPEAEGVTGFYPIEEVTFDLNNKKFNERRAFRTDTHFTSVFSISLLYGAETRDGVLISESIARKYYNDPASAVNQPVRILGEEKFISTVRGVFRDLPGNTHFHYDILFIKDEGTTDVSAWRSTSVYTYVLLNTGADQVILEKKLNDLVDKKSIGAYKFDVLPRVSLQPLRSIHLHSDLQEELEANSNPDIIFYLIIIGMIVLLVAWVNSIILYSAKLIDRTREIGIRKILGSTAPSLIKLFVSEGALASFLSVALALVLSWFLLPVFADFTDKPLSLIGLMEDWYFIFLAVIIILSGIITYAIYPVIFLSAFNPVKALKNEFVFRPAGRISVKKGLIVFQFALTTFVMIFTLVVSRQLHYMMQADLGMNINRQLVIRSPNMIKEEWSDELRSYVIDSSYFRKKQYFKSVLESGSQYTVTSVSHIPGRELVWGTEGFRRAGSLPNDVHTLNMQGIDYDFLDAFDIKLLAGRNFSRDRRSDQLGTVLLNESALHELGFAGPDEAIGNNLVFYDNTKKEIIGIVKDFHQESLKKLIRPTFYQLLPRALDYIVVKIPPENIRHSVSEVKDHWRTVFPDNPFDYFFLDSFFDSQYKNETGFLRVFTIFMVVCIIIANIGLLGLSAYTLSKRTKEIGIRRVLGAKRGDLIVLLSRGFLAVLVTGFIFAVPPAYFVSVSWIRNYAFHVKIAWWLFILPLFTCLAVFALTVGIQALKYVNKNPVDALKSE